MLRVLVVNTGFVPVPPDRGGSIELHSYHLSNELARLGLEIDYVTSINPTVSFQKGVSVHKLPRIPFDFHGNYLQTMLGFCVGGFLASAKAINAINKSRYDIIHVHGHVPGFFLLPLKRKSTFIFTAHNPNPWMVKSFSSLKQAYRICAFKSIELRIVRNFDYVITVSECLKNELVDRFRVNPKKIKVVPNGVDTDFFRPNINNSEEVLIKYHLPKGYALFVGRMVEQKGAHFLLKAIKGTHIHVVMVGGGPLLNYLKELCQRLGISKQVHFIGSVPLCDLRMIYSQAKFLVIPSVAEGFPTGLVGLEAMAMGLPIVASKIEGIEKMVIHRYNGFLFKTGSVEKLRSHIIELFENERLVKIMGNRSRRIVENQFSWAKVAQKHLELYRDLLSN